MQRLRMVRQGQAEVHQGNIVTEVNQRKASNMNSTNGQAYRVPSLSANTHPAAVSVVLGKDLVLHVQPDDDSDGWVVVASDGDNNALAVLARVGPDSLDHLDTALQLAERTAIRMYEGHWHPTVTVGSGSPMNIRGAVS